MKIRFKNESGIPDEKLIIVETGEELENVTAVDIKVRPGEPIMATLEFCFPHTDIVAGVTVSEEHLRELAAAHGFDLVKKEPS